MIQKIKKWSCLASLLILTLTVSSCFQPIDLMPAEQPDIPWVHCILSPADTQYLELRFISSSSADSYRPINGANVVLSEWNEQVGEYVKARQFTNKGEGEYHLITPDGVLGKASSFRLQVFLPDGGDTLTAFTHSVSLEVLRCFEHTSEQKPLEVILHGKDYGIDYSRFGLNDNRLNVYRALFRIRSADAVWAYKEGWSPSTRDRFIEDELATNLEDKTDGFNKTGKLFTQSTTPEALSRYPEVVGQPLHYRYLRFPEGSLSEMDTLMVSGDFTGTHHGVIGDMLSVIRGYHRSELLYDTTAGLFHDTEECHCLFDDNVGYVHFKAVSKEYDNYLKDVFQTDLLRGTDVISIYRNTNHYTNIQGGTGIFGAEVDKKFYWTCGVWQY